jgi:hypothetical protein
LALLLRVGEGVMVNEAEASVRLRDIDLHEAVVDPPRRQFLALDIGNPLDFLAKFHLQIARQV